MFTVDPKIFEAHPNLRVAVIHAQGCSNMEDASAQEARERLSRLTLSLQEKLQGLSFEEYVPITCWRQAYKKFGATPKKHLCSLENLYKSVAQKGEIRSINKLVDIYNMVSLQHGFTMGADDLSKIAGRITLGYASGQLPFTPLGSTESSFPSKGEVVYADEQKVLCRRWNWRECEESKLGTETQDVLFYIEDLWASDASLLEKAVTHLVELLEELAGCTSITHAILTASSSTS